MEVEPVAVTLDTTVATLGKLMTCTTDVVAAVAASPVLCIGIAAVIGGIAISWYKRLTNQRSRGKK